MLQQLVRLAEAFESIGGGIQLLCDLAIIIILLLLFIILQLAGLIPAIKRTLRIDVRGLDEEKDDGGINQCDR